MELYIYSAVGNIIGLIFEPLPPSKIQPVLNTYPIIDQLICIDKTCTIYNRDGTEANQCGNGLRAIAKHLNQPEVLIHLKHSSHQVIREDGKFWVDMGIPQILKTSPYFIGHIGNKHIIIPGEINYTVIDKFKLTHNISFTKIKDANIFIKTYERGAGWTDACGSAACIAAYKSHLTHSYTKWTVSSPGGQLYIHINQNIWQTGDVQCIASYVLA